jgi:hypothetical protein
VQPPARLSRRPNGRRAAPAEPPRVAPLTIDQSVDGLLVRRVRVAPEDVVFVKGVLEASEGLAAMFAEQGGELSIAAPHERDAELAELLADLSREVGALVLDDTDVDPRPGAERLDD